MEAPSPLSRYQLIVRLTEHKAVYLANNLDTERTVVIKVLTGKRKAQEATVALQMSDLYGFVRTYRSFEASPSTLYPQMDVNDPEPLYLEMELLSGNIRDLFNENKPSLSVNQLKGMLFELLLCLSNGWETYRFFHGDLEPANIFYRATERPRIYRTEGRSYHCTAPYACVLGDYGASRVGAGSIQSDWQGYLWVVLDFFVEMYPDLQEEAEAHKERYIDGMTYSEMQQDLFFNSIETPKEE